MTFQDPHALHPRQSSDRFGSEIADRPCGDLGLSPSFIDGMDGTETVIHRYTAGMCDIYAQALQGLVGGQLVALFAQNAGRPTVLIHAGVLLEGRIHDIRQSLKPKWWRQDYDTRGGSRYRVVSAEELTSWQCRKADDVVLHVAEARALLLRAFEMREAWYYRDLASAIPIAA